MSNRDPSVDGRVRAFTGSRPARDPTESMAPGEPEEPAWNELDPLSSSQAPMGTRDHVVRDEPTRVESPAARNRTPQPPAPPESSRRKRESKPSRPPGVAEKPEERIGCVLGSYRLVELLGRGGMGFVYKAEHVKLGRVVALKLLRADYARRRDSVARFFQEARTVNRVRHRNIVDVTDFVELDDGTTFIIMELLEGHSLGKWARGGFTVPRALALLIQICDGLAAAHAVGVIHRDLKPDNVVVIPTGDGAEIVKLLDFGVAKLLNRDDEDIGLQTQAGSVIGTPAYMSPEQAGGTTVDTRSDIYSLGAIMYELFCGQPMFKGRSFGEYVRKHLNEHPPAPRATAGGAGMDERLQQVILRCIEKEPAQRYQSLAELRDDLLHLLGAIDTHVVGIRDLGGTDSLASHDIIMSSRRSAQRSSRRSAEVLPPPELPSAIVARPRRWPWVIAGLAVAGASAAAIAIAMSSSPPSTRARVPAGEPAAAERKPTVESLAGPTAPAPSIVVVELDSVPSGAEVFPRDSDVARCTTPCRVSIDPSDGGSPTERKFIVRAAGHVDEPVTIVLASAPPTLEVELTPIAAPSRSDDGEPSSSRRGKPEAKTRPAAEPEPEPKVEAPEPEPEPEPEPKAEKTEKTEKKDKKDKKDKKKIEKTDTVNPFEP
jgi:serine/threonine-protein kinase